MSELIFKFIRPFFKNLIPIESDYESFFDYYEFINTINYKNYSEYGWYPMGRFAYKDRKIAEIILKRAEKEKSEFELVSAGFFSSYEKLKEEFDKFNEYYKSTSSRYW